MPCQHEIFFYIHIHVEYTVVLFPDNCVLGKGYITHCMGCLINISRVKIQSFLRYICGRGVFLSADNICGKGVLLFADNIRGGLKK